MYIRAPSMINDQFFRTDKSSAKHGQQLSTFMLKNVFYRKRKPLLGEKPLFLHKVLLMTNHQLYLDDTTLVENLEFEPISKKYKNVQIISASIAYIALMALALLLLLADSPWWCIAAEAVIAVAFAGNIAILRKAFQFKGYALREQDFTYRTGAIFPKVTTIPYARIQQVSIGQNPVSKHFGLCSLDVENGAQTLSSISIPGLSEEKAQQIKTIITGKLGNSHD